MEERGAVLTRALTAAVVLPLFVVLAWHPALRPGFTGLVALLAAVGLYEYYAIVRAREISPETIGGILAGTAVTLSGHFHEPAFVNLFLYAGCLLVAALHIVRGQHSVAGLASSMFGVFYVGWLAAHLTLLHSEPDTGPGLVSVLLVAVILTDTGAYLIGSLIGKHKLAPRVSPKKTWEGAAGGLALALAGLVGLYYLGNILTPEFLPDWGLMHYIHAGTLVSVSAQVGDLAESCLKRDAGMKDSGGLFPGHGGVLDRCDGFLFAAPMLYYVYSI